MHYLDIICNLTSTFVSYNDIGNKCAGHYLRINDQQVDYKKSPICTKFCFPVAESPPGIKFVPAVLIDNNNNNNNTINNLIYNL